MSKKKSKPNQAEIWSSYEDELPFEKQSFTPLSLDEIEEESSVEGRLHDEITPLGQVLIGEYEELLVIDKGEEDKVLLEDNPALMIKINHMGEDELPFEKQTFTPISLDDLTELVSDVETNSTSGDNLSAIRAQILAKINQANIEAKHISDSTEKDISHGQKSRQSEADTTTRSKRKHATKQRDSGTKIGQQHPRTDSDNARDTQARRSQEQWQASRARASRACISKKISISRTCTRYHQTRRQKSVGVGVGFVAYRLGVCRTAVR